LLLISTRVSNQSQTKKIDYKGWASSFRSAVHLSDNFDNRYKEITFGTFSDIVGQVKSESIHPGRSIDDLLVFEIPLANVEYLRLELPADHFGEKGEVRFQIPKDMIGR
jgi:hypothetical protein